MTGAMGLEFEYVHGDVAIDDQTFANVGVRYKGNGTYMQGQIAGKLSFKLQLDRFDKGQRLGRITTLNLHSNISDATFMNETLAYRLYRDAGVAAPRTSLRARVCDGHRPTTEQVSRLVLGGRESGRSVLRGSWTAGQRRDLQARDAESLLGRRARLGRLQPGVPTRRRS